MERSFADAKQLHGHRYARFRGLLAVTCQCLLAAAAQNIKKIALALAPSPAPLGPELPKSPTHSRSKQNPAKIDGVCQQYETAVWGESFLKDYQGGFSDCDFRNIPTTASKNVKDSANELNYMGFFVDGRLTPLMPTSRTASFFI